MSNPNSKNPVDTKKVSGGLKVDSADGVIDAKGDATGTGGYCGNPPAGKSSKFSATDVSAISGGGPYAEETTTNEAPKVDPRKVDPKTFDGGGSVGR